MQINLESTEKHSIQAYMDTQVKIDSRDYQNNLIVSRDHILTDWDIRSIKQLEAHYLLPLLEQNPEIIILGHFELGQFPPHSTLESLSKKRIGIECMSIGAACRTYNVLLSEHRAVTLGLIFTN